MSKIILPDMLAEKPDAGVPPKIAFVTPRTPTEQAWADLCDGRENAAVERVMASLGGWEAWANVPLTYAAFCAAWGGDTNTASALKDADTTRAGRSQDGVA